MKKINVFTILGALLIASCSPTSPLSDNPEIAAAQGLARRVVGASRARQIDFHLLPEAAEDVFRLETQDGRISISGNSAGSMAVGLNHYLENICHVTYGWFKEDVVRLPRRLPLPAEPMERKARVPQRFFLNYCTSGYTLPWWKWDDWEHFIDWMALNGVNLPLAVSGQEAIWYEVWTEMGLSDEEVRGYFTGPGHLPWHRMSNIDHWGGPLPKSWLRGQLELQKRIVSRERELSMRPVLPAFAGHVPAALKTVHPEAKIDSLSLWGGFTKEYVPSFLDPLDPLFPQIQKLFLEKQASVFGTSHVYGIDPFNEMVPPSWEPEYLATVGREVYKGLAAVDPEAVWLQMGWLFWYQRRDWTPERVKAYLTSYPADRQFVLDYYCEFQEIWRSTESFFGVPYIWCYLGNFGGNTMLFGNLKESGERLEEALRSGGENLQGIGCTLEALDCNPYSYSYILSKAWEDWDYEEYAAHLADCRSGGVVSPELEEAWKTFFAEVYSSGTYWKRDAIINQRPSVDARRGRFDSGEDSEYDNAVLRDMLEAMLASGASGRAYNFDLVNICRQWLGNMCSNLNYRWREAYAERDLMAMKAVRAEFLSVMDDIDAVLAYEPYFLVGKWIKDARGWGANREEADYFEGNARNLITSWGFRGIDLTDYAKRTVRGLVRDYYKPRWQLFFETVEAAMDNYGVFTEEEAKALREKTLDLEASWWQERGGTYRTTPKKGAAKAVRKLLDKYE